MVVYPLVSTESALIMILVSVHLVTLERFAIWPSFLNVTQIPVRMEAIALLWQHLKSAIALRDSKGDYVKFQVCNFLGYQSV